MRSHAIALKGIIPALSLLFMFLGLSPALAETVLIEENAEEEGVRLQSQTRSGVEIQYRMARFDIESIDVYGQEMQLVALPGVILPNDAGAPNLPGIGRAIAIPRGATARFEIIGQKTRTYGDIDLVPAPPIQKENDDSPPRFDKDPAIYERDAAWPASPVVLSEPTQVRGVDMVYLGVTPFQYNPVTKEVTVYTELDIRIDFAGGNGQFGEDRLRNRYWEPMLRDHLLNYETLPPMNPGSPMGNRDGFEYVIICPDNPDFIPWADSLKAWRKLQGISTEYFTTSQTGATANQIESWINDAYNDWDVAPVAFLILGDYPGTGDERDNGVIAPIWSGYCASDNIYADVSGNNLPDMAHGRITARNSDDLQEMIGRMFTYEREPVMDPYFYQHPLIAGGWQTERWFILCTETLYGHQEVALGKEPVREYAIYSGYPGSVWSSNPNTYMVVNYFGPSGLGYIPATPGHLNDWGGNATRILDAIDQGTYFVMHRDHGSVTGWGEPYFSIAHMGLITNDDPPFVFTINCLTGMYNSGGQCFTEKWHRMDHGALGLIAASETSYSFVNDTFVWGVFDGLWPDFDPGYGAAENGGADDLRTAFAHSSGKHYLQVSSWPYNPQHKVYTHHLFHHHGDAFMTLNSEVPVALTVLHDDYLELGASTFAVQANADAVIALTVEGEIIGVADATGGMQSIPIVPQNDEGTLRITVTKANHLRYDVEIPIELGSILVKADGTGDYPTIQSAIDAVSDGTLIELEDGVYTGNGNRDVDYHGKLVTVQSQSGNPANCIIDCQGNAVNTHRGFIFQSGETSEAVLRQITIRNGFIGPPAPLLAGGAIVCDGSSPTFTGLVLSSNYAITGGGMYCRAAAPALNNCAFDLNSSSAIGGGALCEEGSLPQLTFCAFTNNTTNGVGGALACLGASSPTLSLVTFTGNQALGGGGLYLWDGSNPNVLYCTFEDNATQGDQDGCGGAMLCAASEPTLTNCRFTANTADSSGGAIHFADASASLTRCILVENSAQSGGAIGFANSSPAAFNTCTLYGNEATLGGGLCLIEGSVVDIQNTIIAFGTLGEAIYAHPGTSALLTCCDLFGNAGGDWVGGLETEEGVNGNFSLDPFFCDAPGGDFHLWNYSPCMQVGCGQIGAEGVGCWDPQAIEGAEPLSGLQLARSQPNPFMSSTRISYRIPGAADGAPVTLEVFDLSGRLVRTLINEPQSTGDHVASWDGRDETGTPATGGVYYYVLRAQGESITKRLVLLH